MATNDIWRHAFAYAEKGICVVPLRPLAKAPAIRNWPELATSDLRKIERWSRAHPDANIGIVPGKSELAVFDVDFKSDGLASWNALVNEVGGLDVFDRSPTVKTPSGGFHAYFRKQTSLRIETCLGIVRGVDFFCTTGQLVAPPSRLREAGYEWRAGEYVEPPFLPQPVIRWLKAHERKTFASALADTIWSFECLKDTTPIPDTTRHTTLMSYGGKMRAEGCSPELVAAVIRGMNLTRCKPPIEGKDLEYLLRSIVGYNAGFDGMRYRSDWLPEMSGTEAILAVALSDMAFHDGTITVPQVLLYAKTGMDRRTCSDAAKRLEEKGALKRRFGARTEGGRDATTYRLLYRSRNPGG